MVGDLRGERRSSDDRGDDAQRAADPPDDVLHGPPVGSGQPDDRPVGSDEPLEAYVVLDDLQTVAVVFALVPDRPSRLGPGQVHAREPGVVVQHVELGLGRVSSTARSQAVRVR